MNINIPPAALEAGATVLTEYGITAATDEDLARAAFNAMVEAWPGMAQLGPHPSGHGRSQPALILPLPQEASDE